MKLHISPSGTVRELNKEFSIMFPYLKIVLFKTRHESSKGSFSEDRFGDEMLLGEINGNLKNRTIEVNPRDTVILFEKLFQDELGLPVQVFRKAGNAWLETIQTDHLTLMKQNQMGAESVTPVRINQFTLFL